VLCLRPNPDAPPVLRSYSLSDAPSTDHYRVSIKQELNGVGSTYVHQYVRVGDVLDVSAPRGNFTLQPSDRPILLLSASVGAMPVLSMLYPLNPRAQFTSPSDLRAGGLRFPSRVVASSFDGTQNTMTCLSSLRPATSPSGGRVGLESVTIARAD
jgi:FAD-dependent oxidoreductase family protein